MAAPALAASIALAAICSGERGTCGVRENRGGKYVTLVHSRPCAVHSDPIEKKPLFHVLPGTTALSIATAGCNMECRFCQNWEISQFRPEQVRSYDLPPARIARLARDRGDATIAYTYTEPVVFAEYVRDCGKAGRARGVGSVMISNGYIEEKPLRDLIPHLTAVKIDLKAFTERFYRKVCGGHLAPVLETLEFIKHETDTWLELTTLLIPGENDSEAELHEMTQWVVERLGPDVPMHFTAFHPDWKMRDVGATPAATLRRARKIAMGNGVRFAYTGNVHDTDGGSTFCAGCGELVQPRAQEGHLEARGDAESLCEPQLQPARDAQRGHQDGLGRHGRRWCCAQLLAQRVEQRLEPVPGDDRDSHSANLAGARRRFTSAQAPPQLAPGPSPSWRWVWPWP